MNLALSRNHSHTSQQGNILVYILIGITLIGLLTAALRMNGNSGDIDKEKLGIRATEVQRYAAKIQEAVNTVLQNGVSESNLRFASPHSDTAHGGSTNYGAFDGTPANNTNQVFHPIGGNAEYKLPPAGIQDTLQPWEFLAQSHIPQIGSDKYDLIMVLPNVTQEFCLAIDKQLGFKDIDPDTPTTFPSGVTSGAPSCIYDSTDGYRFDGTFPTGTNTISSTANFSRLPAPQACVKCGTAYHYYYVLLSR